MKNLYKLAFPLSLAFAFASSFASPATDALASSPHKAFYAQQLKFTSTTPTEGETLASLPDGYIVKVVPAIFNEYPDLYLEYEIEAASVGGMNWTSVKTYASMKRNNAEGCYTAEIPLTITLNEGFDYRIKINSWENEALTQKSMDLKRESILAVGYINFKGSTPKYQMSPYSFLGIDPQPAEDKYFPVLPADCEYLTVEFDGPVNLGSSKDTGIVIGGGAGNSAFKSLDPVGDSEIINNVTYAKKWNLVLPNGYCKQRKQPFMVSMKAHDSEGRAVQGEIGEEDLTYSLFNYNVPGQFGEVNFDFGSEPVKTLSEIIASFSIGINYSYQYTYASAYITKDGNRVAYVKDIELIFDSESLNAKAKRARMILDNQLTESGDYTLCLPDGYFTLGTEFSVSYQKACEVPFRLEGDSSNVESIPDSAPMQYVVYDACGVKVLDTHDAEALKSLKGLYIVNGKKVILK